MKYFVLTLSLLIMLFTFSCAHQSQTNGISIIATTTGLMKKSNAPFPIYLTNTPINRADLEKKHSPNIYIVHTGHILDSALSKEDNEKNMEKLISEGINLINLTLEDFVIAEALGINFEVYNQTFLNSSVIDLSTDDLATAKNIKSYEIREGLAFIGLSDSKLDKKLAENISKEKYIINDYVLSILKVKKNVLKNLDSSPVQSFVIIHTLGNAIDEVMNRLPPSFINSLAD
ncbi:MAG: hypothetical protein Q7U04_15655 [Bacteriovorax sp.]|nr:hypothetical protein [Bacteriovorax sp.]